MKRATLGLVCRGKVLNTSLRRMIGSTEAVERITHLNWSRAGHVTMRTDNRWARRITERLSGQAYNIWTHVAAL